MSEENEALLASLAEELRQEREHRGISLNNISDATKINIRFLRAIERGEFNCIEEPYVRIFLKTYAREVGLDAAPILERYDKIKGEQKELPPLPKVAPPSGASLKAGEEATSPAMSNRTIGILALGLLVLIVVGVRLFGPQPEDTPSTPPLPQESPSPTSVTSEPSTGQEQPAPLGSEAGVFEKARPDSLRLEGTAREETWVLVEAGGRTLFTGVLKKGRTQVWTALDTLTLTLGRPGGIDLVLNGKDIAEDWPAQGTVHLRITREGPQVLTNWGLGAAPARAGTPGGR